MAIEITIELDHHERGIYLVEIPEHVSAAFVPRHRNYFSALAEGLRLQREFRPAILHDRVGAGGADAAS